MYKKFIYLTFFFALCTTAMGSDIAFYVGQWNTDGWYDASQFDDVDTIIAETEDLFNDIEQFDDTQLAAFGEWVDENTNDGELDIIWLNGCMPSVLYPLQNGSPDGSRIELWLDGGNMVINVGDWFAYVSYETGARVTPENTGTGAANILDLAAAIIAGSAQGEMVVTPAGQQYIPSLNSVTSDRPVSISAVVAPWEVAEIFAQNAAGTYADPVVLHNVDTEGYLAIINQGGSGNWIADRGMTCAEFIKNWVAGEIGLGEPVIKARQPNPADGAEGVVSALLQWKGHQLAAFHDVYFGTNPTPGPDEFRGRLRSIQTVYYHADGLIPGTTYYWRIDEVEADETTIHAGDVWSFSVPALSASKPDPPDGAKWIQSDVTLSWSAGWGSIYYQVYLSADLDAVTNGTTGADKGIVGGSSYAATGLDSDTTYYWRVDAFDDKGAWHTGDVWSFTTLSAYAGVKAQYYHHPGTTPPSPPESAFETLVLTRVDPGINFSWGDPGSPDPSVNVDDFSARWVADLEVPVSDTYTFWTYTDDGVMLWFDGDLVIDNWTDHGNTWNNSPAFTLTAGDTHAIEMWWYERGGGATAQLHWSTPTMTRRPIPPGPLSLPLKASRPNPANGAVDVKQTPTLSWSAGAEAAQHDVYLGTDRDAVANADTTTAGVYRGRQALDATSYVPTEAPLAWNTAYYWRIDEVNGVDVWQGTVWSLTTSNCLIVDDFEEYDDFCNRIFYAWKDGWGYSADPDCGVTASTGNGTGSTVGNLQPPFAEQTIVHGGNQSMPFEYNNSGTGGKARYSEASLEFAVAQNWTTHDIKGLSLWFHGEAGNDPETLYVALEDSAAQVRVATHPNPEALQVVGWQPWYINPQQFSGVNLASVKKVYLGVGNRNNPQMGGSGKLYIDDIRVCPPQCVPSLGKPAADLSGNCIVDYADVEIVADEWLNDGFVVTPSDPGTSGLIAHYPFNGNANDVVGGHNGTTTGFVSYGAGKIGQAIILDGVDDLVTVGPVGISGAAPRTISGWVKANATIDSLPNWIDIFGFVGPTADPRADMSFDMEIGEAQGRRGYVIHVYGWERVIMDVDFEWHHLAASYDGTTIAWYGDGRLVGTDDSRPLDTRDQVHMGKRDDNANYFPGRVDEVRIFSRVLPAAQIAWLAGHTAPISIPADLYQDDVIDFKDLAVLGDAWLEEILWP
jgi:hypothetical protein